MNIRNLKQLSGGPPNFYVFLFKKVLDSN